MRRSTKIRTGIVAGAAALALAGGGAAFAATGSQSAPAPAAPKVYSACDQYGVNVMHYDWNGAACPSGWYKTSWSDTNGSLSGTWALPAPGTIVTGGSFNAKSTDIGSLPLKAGTYLVTFNAKATPNAANTAEVFPQFFVYNQVKNASFAGDEFNVGAGALEPFIVGASSQHDSYYSGTGQITVPAGGETLHMYAFGYDSDQSNGTYTLDSAGISVIRVG
jgi:hypothetical protein